MITKIIRKNSIITYNFCTFARKSEKMEQNLVSVIMPTYNSSRFLADSIESVLNQTYKNIELLITDDCSSDGKTHDILRCYEDKDKRVRVFYQKENMGAGVARNVSIRNARGRYIAFCDSDDRWFPDKLERQIGLMKSRNCLLCCSSYILCDDNNNEMGICIAPKRISYKNMLCDNKIGCLTAVYDVKGLGQKFLMPSLRKRQDWALFLTIIHKCGIAYGIKEPLAYYRMRKGSISNRKLSLIKYNAKVYQKVLGFSVAKSYAYFFFCFMPAYTVKVLKRKYDSYVYIAKIKRTATSGKQ